MTAPDPKKPAPPPARPTTLAVGEEEPPPKEGDYTTMAVGEEEERQTSEAAANPFGAF